MKSQILNILRQLIKIKPVENLLVSQSLNGSNIAKKIIGPNTIYSKGSIRTCTRNEIKFELDISDYMEHAIYFGLLNVPDFDRDDLYSMVRPGQVIFDIGGNIGDTTLHFAKIQNNKGKIYCFEPVPVLFDRLKKNIGLNSFTNISIQNMALSDKREDLFFNLPKAQNSSGIFLSNNPSEEGKKVHSLKLDDFCSENKIDKLDLIKIDVEGFELRVLNGANETLQKFKPKMFIEINDAHLQRAGGSAKEVIRLLEKNNYTINRADNNETINSQYSFEGKHFDIVCEQST